MTNGDVFILYIQHHGYWCPGDAKSQGISSHDTDLLSPEYFSSAPDGLTESCLLYWYEQKYVDKLNSFISLAWHGIVFYSARSIPWSIYANKKKDTFKLLGEI